LVVHEGVGVNIVLSSVIFTVLQVVVLSIDIITPKGLYSPLYQKRENGSSPLYTQLAVMVSPAVSIIAELVSDLRE